MKPFLSFILVTAALAVFGCRSTNGVEVVSDFDIDRYMGKWYEVARFPHRFERELTAVTAEYQPNPNGTIKVINRGYHSEKGMWREAKAIGKFKGDLDIGWLEVAFFRPFYADYKILHLDDEYSEAIITGPSKNYLWILARNPSLSGHELERLIRMAHEAGFDTNRIERIDQTLNL